MVANSRPYLTIDLSKTEMRITSEQLEKLWEEEYERSLKNKKNLEDDVLVLAQYTETQADINELKRSSLEKAKAGNHSSSLQKKLEEFKSYTPEEKDLYIRLYSLKQSIDAELVAKKDADGNPLFDEKGFPLEEDREQAELKKGKNGWYLAVEAYKPGDISFTISDGKLEFDPKGMDPSKMRELFDFLERRGLGSMLDWNLVNQPAPFTLENADDKTQKIFNSVVKQIKEQNLENAGKPDIMYTCKAESAEESQDANETPEVDNNGAGNGNSEEDSPAPDDSPAVLTSEPEANEPRVDEVPIPAPTQKKRNVNADYQEAIASLDKWMKKNKREELTFFKRNQDGYVVYTVFEKESRDNMELDGVIDKKTKELKARHEIKIYVKVDSNGVLEVSFSLPPGKNLNESYMDRLGDAWKDAGIKRVRMCDGISDINEAIMREGFGRALVVPVGHKLTATRLAKIFKAAEGKHGENNPKVFRYKRDLALQMASNIMKKSGWDFRDHPNDEDCRCCRHTIGSYQLHPFRDLWEDYGLCDHIKTTIKNNDHSSGNPDGAVEIIGSVRAAKRLFDIYKTFCSLSIYRDASVGEMLAKCNEKDLNADEKREFAAYLKSVGISQDVPLHDMNEMAKPSPLLKLGEILEKRCKEETRRDLENEFRKNSNSKYNAGENKETTTIRTFLSEAAERMKDINNELTDNMLKPIFQPHLGKPDYNFEHIRQKMREEGMVDDTQEEKTPPRSYGRSQKPFSSSRGGMGD